MRYSSVIYYYWENWHCLAYLITCLNIPLSETALRMAHSSVIYYYRRNWHCLAYLITCLNIPLFETAVRMAHSSVIYYYWENWHCLTYLITCHRGRISFMCGDAWCNGLNVCFSSLPPMLLFGFESLLGLESSGFSMWHFLKLVAKSFLLVLRFPPLLHRLMVQPVKESSNKLRFQLCQTC